MKLLALIAVTLVLLGPVACVAIYYLRVAPRRRRQFEARWREAHKDER